MWGSGAQYKPNFYDERSMFVTLNIYNTIQYNKKLVTRHMSQANWRRGITFAFKSTYIGVTSGIALLFT
jgi:hypothetical protein